MFLPYFSGVRYGLFNHENWFQFHPVYGSPGSPGHSAGRYADLGLTPTQTFRVLPRHPDFLPLRPPHSSSFILPFLSAPSMALHLFLTITTSLYLPPSLPSLFPPHSLSPPSSPLSLPFSPPSLYPPPYIPLSLPPSIPLPLPPPPPPLPPSLSRWHVGHR